MIKSFPIVFQFHFEDFEFIFLGHDLNFVMILIEIFVIGWILIIDQEEFNLIKPQTYHVLINFLFQSNYDSIVWFKS